MTIENIINKTIEELKAGHKVQLEYLPNKNKLVIMKMTSKKIIDVNIEREE